MHDKPTLTYDAVEVGRELGPLRYRVEPELVRGHLAAVGQSVPPFLENPAGVGTGRGILIEPGVLVRHYIRLLRTAFRVEGALHARTEISLCRPAPAAQTLTVTGRVADKYVRRGRSYLVVESTAVDEDGHEICRGRDTLALAATGR